MSTLKQDMIRVDDCLDVATTNSVRCADTDWWTSIITVDPPKAKERKSTAFANALKRQPVTGYYNSKPRRIKRVALS